MARPGRDKPKAPPPQTDANAARLPHAKQSTLELALLCCASQKNACSLPSLPPSLPNNLPFGYSFRQRGLFPCPPTGGHRAVSGRIGHTARCWDLGQVLERGKRKGRGKRETITKGARRPKKTREEAVRRGRPETEKNKKKAKRRSETSRTVAKGVHAVVVQFFHRLDKAEIKP